MNRTWLYGVLLVAAVAVAYLAIANRQLSRRLREADARHQSRLATDSDAALDPVRRIPRRASFQNRTGPSRFRAAPPSEPSEAAGADGVVTELGEKESRLELPNQNVVPMPAPGAVAGVVNAWPVVVPESDWIRYNAREGSHCLVEGIASVRNWEAESKVIAGQITIAPGLDFTNRGALAAFSTNLPCTVAATIPVRSLKSALPGFDEILQTSLEMQRFPTIQYQMRALFYDDSTGSQGAPILFRSLGELILHGVTNQLEMPVAVEARPTGWLSVSGSAWVKMSEFGIVAPQLPGAASSGSAGDQVKVSLAWKLERVTR